VDHERRERWRKTRKCAAAIRIFRALSCLSWSKCPFAMRKACGPRTARKVANGTKVCRRDSCLSRSFASIVVQMPVRYEEGVWTTNGAKGGERRERVPPRFVSFALFRALSCLSWSKCPFAMRKSRGPRTARKVAKDAKGCRRDSCLSRSFVSIVVQMPACHEEVAWTTNGAKGGGERRERVPPRFVSFALFHVYRGPNACSL
jgi:hypothetical protein